MTVIDASAVLALLQDERGAEVVEDAIEDGVLISAVNLSEVLGKMADVGVSADAAADLVTSLFVEVVPFGLASAREAARLRAALPSAGLSLGDRACLGLARSRGLAAVTADRAWLGLADEIAVEVRSIR